LTYSDQSYVRRQYREASDTSQEQDYDARGMVWPVASK
jgi:hypothetical protein